MQRRDGSGQPAKEQRKSRPKARKAPTAHVSNADLQEQLGRAIRERDEALERQAATSEVLQVISSSSGKLEPVFQAMLREREELDSDAERPRLLGHHPPLRNRHRILRPDVEAGRCRQAEVARLRGKHGIE